MLKHRFVFAILFLCLLLGWQSSALAGGTIVPWPPEVGKKLCLPIEKPTWDRASALLFRRQAEALVVDVRTGYAFHVKRTGGVKHADVEPLAPVDTATLKKAAGGFSWARRPIWVITGGHRMAASMNCMPHGYDTISTNGMRGQFCIHFVGSRTHGSNRVDPDHQCCIEEAWRAGLAMKTLPTVPCPKQPPLLVTLGGAR